MSWTGRLSVVAVAVVLGVSAYAPGADQCVSDQAGLRAALAAAQNNGQNDLIRVVQGLYQWNGGFDFINTDDKDFHLLGGFAPATGCDWASRVVDPTNTILDANGYDRVLDITSFSSGNTINIEGFTVINGAVDGRGGGINILTGNGDIVNVTISHNIIADNSATIYGAGLSFGTDGTVKIVNNLFHGNHAGIANGAASLTFNGPSAYVVNNTIADNTDTSGTGCGGMRIGGGASPGTATTVRNNIFWNNTTSDLYLTGTPVVDSFTNDIGVSGFNPPASSTGDLSVDPMFETGDNNYHLQLVSPLVDVGSVGANLPPFDLEGNPRVQGQAPDLGVYEVANEIFSDGFESGDFTAWSS